MARAIVTGGAGFIGSHVADRFLERGDEVLVLDDLSTGREDFVPDAATFERVDIVDDEALGRAFDAFEPDVVFHLAAQASVTVSMERPEYFAATPMAPYGASKQAGEAYVAAWGRIHRTPNVILRLGNIYGPRQNPEG